MMMGCKGRHDVGTGNAANDSVRSVCTNQKAAYDSISSLEQRAATDSSLRGTEAYRRQMERYHRQVAEGMKGMDDGERLLRQYELALNSLHELTNGAHAQNAVKDPSYVERLQQYGHQVQEIYEQLRKTRLTPSQKKRFDALNKRRDGH
jgi:hypothetical protein